MHFPMFLEESTSRRKEEKTRKEIIAEKEKGPDFETLIERIVGIIANYNSPILHTVVIQDYISMG